MLTSIVNAIMLSRAARHKYNLGISLNWILEKLATRTGVWPRRSVDIDPSELPRAPTEENEVGWGQGRHWR